MVGMVIVSHSATLADGVVELSKMMAQEAPIFAAGGLEDGGLGTSFEKIEQAIKLADQGQGVLILMDMGSAVMTAEMVVESLPDIQMKMVDCPLVEGAVAGAVAIASGMSVEEVEKMAKEAGQEAKF